MEQKLLELATKHPHLTAFVRSMIEEKVSIEEVTQRLLTIADLDPIVAVAARQLVVWLEDLLKSSRGVQIVSGKITIVEEE